MSVSQRDCSLISAHAFAAGVATPFASKTLLAINPSGENCTRSRRVTSKSY